MNSNIHTFKVIQEYAEYLIKRKINLEIIMTYDILEEAAEQLEDSEYPETIEWSGHINFYDFSENNENLSDLDNYFVLFSECVNIIIDYIKKNCCRLEMRMN